MTFYPPKHQTMSVRDDKDNIHVFGYIHIDEYQAAKNKISELKSEISRLKKLIPTDKKKDIITVDDGYDDDLPWN